MKLVCPYCKTECSIHKFETKDNIFYAYDKDNPQWIECDKEAKGFIRSLKDKNIYIECAPIQMDSYPFYEGNDLGTNVNKELFRFCLVHISFFKNSILELGCSQGWASNQFTKLGFKNVVAMDISDDEHYGLKFCNKLQEYTKRPFQLVCGDSAYLPFEENSFEVVYINASFHHFREKEKVIQEIYRVLKPGGMFIASGEPPRALDVTLEGLKGRDDFHGWSKYNINEEQPTVIEYWNYLSLFDDFYIYPFSTKEIKMWPESPEMELHKEYDELYNQLSNRTKSKWCNKKRKLFNHWLTLQDNTVMIGWKKNNDI